MYVSGHVWVYSLSAASTLLQAICLVMLAAQVASSFRSVCKPLPCADHSCVLLKRKEADLAAAYVQATVEAGYLVAQAVLYVCVLYFMAGFDRTAGEIIRLRFIAIFTVHHFLFALMCPITCVMPVWGACTAPHNAVSRMPAAF